MPKHNNLDVYPLKQPSISQDDYVFGTDSQTANKKSKNFKVSELISLVTGNDNDKILYVGDIIIDDGNLTIPENLQWRIAGVIFTKTTITEFIDIPFSSVGFVRKDIIVVNNSGDVELIKGTESNTLVVAPNVPNSKLLLVEVDVKENAITTTTPIVGGEFVKKIYTGAISIFLSGSDVSVPLPANGKSLLNFTNPALNSIAGFDLTQFTGIPTDELPYEGKPFVIFNNKNTPLTLTQYDDVNAPIWFNFKGAADIIIPPNEHITVLYYSGGCLDLYRSWYDSNQTIQQVTDYEKILFQKANGTFGTHTGNGLETTILVLDMDGGVFEAGDMMGFLFDFTKIGIAGSVDFKIRAGVTGTTTDELIALMSGFGRLDLCFERKRIQFLSGNIIQSAGANNPTDASYFFDPKFLKPLTYSAKWKLSVSVQLENPADTINLVGYNLKQSKSTL